MAVDPQNQSLLFSLPWEVRENIYDRLLAFRYADFEHTTRPDHIFLDNPHTKPLPPAMLACKRLYRELAPAVHQTAALRACMFEHGRRVGFAVHGNLRVGRLHVLYLLVAMEHANWNAWLRFAGEVLRRAGELQELVVDWEPRRTGGGRTGGAAAAKGFLAQHERRMEEQFFGVVAGVQTLETLRIHGDVPGYWLARLGEMTSARIVHSRTRWWKEDGRDDVVVCPFYSKPKHEEYSAFSRI
ncbi:hypothetical protein NKR23_g9398 [Pleurostoma richardsiae]|uniref:Uncharacterized protein n=1 Tax=Pleurostoma richardsiae TaxID=41990 RepID=A0AA38R726_9PEZI|nr:hypothetical protein NKR23_g9398 [Pleurostoma richardsiae]